VIKCDLQFRAPKINSFIKIYLKCTFNEILNILRHVFIIIYKVHLTGSAKYD